MNPPGRLDFLVRPRLLKSGPRPTAPPGPPVTDVSTEGVLRLEFFPLAAFASGFIIHQLDFPVPSF